MLAMVSLDHIYLLYTFLSDNFPDESAVIFRDYSDSLQVIII